MIEITPSPACTFRVARFHYRDTLQGLFTLELQVVTELGGPSTRELVGRELTLQLGGRGAEATTGGPVPAIRGIIRRAELDPGPADRAQLRYHLEVAPPHHVTTLRRNCRIFQNMSVPEIVAQVLGEYQSLPAPVMRLHDSYPAREYTTQYGESDQEFLWRLLADQGITTYFDHTANSVLVLTDRPASAGPESPAIDGAGRTGGGRALAGVEIGSSLQLGVTIHRDLDFTRPGYRIEGTQRSVDLHEHEDEMESYQFALGVESEGDGATARARRQLEASRARSHHVTVNGSFLLAAGARAQLTGHHRSELSERMIVVGATFGGMGDALETGSTSVSGSHGVHGRYECVPESIGYRPTPIAKPRLLGTHTALVVPSEPGQEIDVDPYLRVLLAFPWDRRELRHNTSRRVRVSQGWAGPNYGFVTIPRVGDEVLVEFLAGDPDQPVITGRLFNGMSPPPLQLPQERTRSVWRTRSTPGGEGYNELLFEDRAGQEFLSIRAERDHRTWVGHDASVEVRNNQSCAVAGDRTLGVEGAETTTIGGASRLAVGADRAESIEGSFHGFVRGSREELVLGRHSRTVEGTATEHVGGSSSLSVTDDRIVTVGRHHTLVVGARGEPGVASSSTFVHGQQTISATDGLVLSSDAAIAIVCGESRIELTPEKIILVSKTVEVRATDEVHAIAGDGPALHLTKVAELSGKEVKLYSDGASLELDSNASLNGSKVQLAKSSGSKSSYDANDAALETVELKVRATMPNGDGYGGKHYRLLVEGQRFEGTTAANGLVQATIPKAAKTAHLTVWTGSYPSGPTLVWQMAIGELPDISTPAGAAARLGNLGHAVGTTDDDPDTRAAIRDYQRHRGLPQTGQLDTATLGRLGEDHGS
ncbi:MAG: type VI secretion system tip protein TssI/VgrG [Polyangiaceae bacterium]